MKSEKHTLVEALRLSNNGGNILRANFAQKDFLITVECSNVTLAGIFQPTSRWFSVAISRRVPNSGGFARDFASLAALQGFLADFYAIKEAVRGWTPVIHLAQERVSAWSGTPMYHAPLTTELKKLGLE